MMSKALIAVCLLLVASVNAVDTPAPIPVCEANKVAATGYAEALVVLAADVQTYVQAVIDSDVAVKAYAEAWESARAKSLASAVAISSRNCVEGRVTALAVAGADATTAAYASIALVVEAKAKASASLELSAFAYADAFSGSCSCTQTSELAVSTAFLQAMSEIEATAVKFVKIYKSATATAAAFAEAFAGADAQASACL